MMVGKFPSPYSYLLLKDKHRLYPRGSLLKLKRSGIYESYSHHFALSSRSSPTKNNCPEVDDEVAPLTQEEFNLLDAILSPTTRYTVYSTPGKLAWGVGLKVGDTVLARLPPKGGRGSPSPDQWHREEFSMATVRWSGLVKNKHMFGVEIMEEQYYRHGDTDGTYHYTEQRCFYCRENCGLFLTLDKMKMPPLLQAVTSYLQGRVLKLERKLRSRTLRAQELSDSESRLKREVTDLEEKVGENRRAIIQCQGEVVKKDNKISELQNELDALQSSTTLKCQVEAEMKDNTITELRNELMAKDALIQSSTATLKCQEEAEMKEKIIAGLRCELRAKEILLQQERESSFKWQAEVVKKDSQIAKLQEELKVTGAQVEEEVRERGKVIVRWKGEVRTKENKIAELRAELRAMAVRQSLLEEQLRDEENLSMEWKSEVLKRDDVLTDLQVEVREGHKFQAELQERVREGDEAVCSLKKELLEQRRCHFGGVAVRETTGGDIQHHQCQQQQQGCSEGKL